MASNPIKQRPTATIGAAYTVAQVLVAYLTAKGYIPADFAKQWGWLVEGGVTAVAFLLLWFHVVPWSKAQDAFAQLEDGRLPDVDVIRLVQGVGELLGVDALGKHTTGTDHPDTAAVGEPVVPTLDAGAPAQPTTVPEGA